jgi:hypothetical protein
MFELIIDEREAIAQTNYEGWQWRRDAAGRASVM